MRIAGLILGMLVVSTSVSATQDVVAGKWLWIGIRGAETVEVGNPSDYTLEFDGAGGYVLRADCNRGAGTYSLEGDRLDLGPAAMTLAACGDASQAGRLLSGLDEVLTVSRAGDRLSLVLPGADSRLEFELEKPLALPGSRWNVRAVNNGKGGVQSVLTGTALEFSFAESGKLTGSAGCNAFFADYVLDGDALRLGRVASLRKMCAKPEGIMQQETQFLEALGSVVRFEVDGDRLTLRSESGALAIDAFSGVTGRVSLRAKRALPVEAVVEIVLEDVSRADAASESLARQRILPAGGQPPFDFELRYDPARIDPRHRYALRARITGADDRLIFVTTTSNPVITGDAPIAGVELNLDPVP